VKCKSFQGRNLLHQWHLFMPRAVIRGESAIDGPVKKASFALDRVEPTCSLPKEIRRVLPIELDALGLSAKRIEKLIHPQVGQF
jgi:hypothetical protein